MMKSIPRLFRREFFVFDTTGPGLVFRTLAEYPGFPGEDVCDPNSWHCFGAYGVHLQGIGAYGVHLQGRWRMRMGFMRRRLNALWESTTIAWQDEDVGIQDV